jgi:uncharacterized membrane protein
MNWKRILLRVLLFAFMGLLMELFFTGLGTLARGDWDMRGHSSPWMMPVYGLLGLFVAPISEPLKRRHIPLPARAFVYMLLIFFVEYVSGTIFTKMGLHIWNYSHHRFNLQGQITLLYAPFWFGLGLCVEYLYKKLDACAVTMVRGFSAEYLLKKENPCPDSQSC